MLLCFRLRKVQRRIANGFDVVSYYANNQWDFCNEGILYLRSLLNESERKVFNLDSSGVDIPKYVETCVLAARRYILNEPDHTLPKARRIMKM